MLEEIKFLVCIDYNKELNEILVLHAIYKKLLKFKLQYRLEMILISCMHENQQQLFLSPSNQIKREHHEIIDDFLDQYLITMKLWEDNDHVKISKIAGEDYYTAISQYIKDYGSINNMFFSYSKDKSENSDNFSEIINKLYKKFSFPIIIIPNNITERKLNFLL